MESPAQRDHLSTLFLEVGGPIVHQVAAALEQVGARVACFRLIPHHVRQCRVDDLAWMVRPLGSPVPERRPEAGRPPQKSLIWHATGQVRLRSQVACHVSELALVQVVFVTHAVKNVMNNRSVKFL